MEGGAVDHQRRLQRRRAHLDRRSLTRRALSHSSLSLGTPRWREALDPSSLSLSLALSISGDSAAPPLETSAELLGGGAGRGGRLGRGGEEASMHPRLRPSALGDGIASSKAFLVSKRLQVHPGGKTAKSCRLLSPPDTKGS
jgi:hypothetical protein